MKVIEDVPLRRTVIRFLLNYCARCIFTGIVVYCCWIYIEHYEYWFTWHVILCTLGLLPFMAEALLLFSADDLWSKSLTRPQKYAIHGGLMVLGSILIIAGSATAIHNRVTVRHFNNAHGTTGLVSMILIIISLVLGVLTNYVQRLDCYFSPLTAKFSHNCIGLLGFVVGLVSLCFSYYTERFMTYTSEESRDVALGATILGSLWTLNSALFTLYNQTKTMLRRLFVRRNETSQKFQSEDIAGNKGKGPFTTESPSYFM